MNSSCLAALLLALLIGLSPVPAHAGFLDDLTRTLGFTGSVNDNLDDATIVKGLKEALATGTSRAVTSVSKQDGYFGNQMIRVVMPEKLRSAADLLSRFGFSQEVDGFVLAMNRAAEKAAPKASVHFISALKAISFDDARDILQGEGTAATSYFRQKTSAEIYNEFKPVVSKSLQDVGAVQSYKQLMDKINSIPFAGSMVAFDLDHYVTSKAVEGLFTMLGEEEKKIRNDPAARGTELLRRVFGAD